MQHVRITTTFTILLPLFLQVFKTGEVTERNVTSCGSLLGDHRYCLNYTSFSPPLYAPPDGANVTSILDLSHNKIQTISDNKFNSHRLLIRLDLSHNDIKNVKPDAFKPLKSLKKIKLGNNPYSCDYTVCAFRTWVFNNKHLIEDLNSVTCETPVQHRGRRVIDLDPEDICRNGTIHHGFEINTGTVFMIWIVVPIMITTLTAFYIVLNGNNRFGRAVRGCFLACCQRSISNRRAERTPEREEYQESGEDQGSGRTETQEHFSGSNSGQENLAPVESVGQLEMEEVRPGPSNASAGSFW